MSPRSPALNARLREESRRAIIEHALELFGADGYERTSMKKIAEAAGISPGLIYHYFDSKERLLDAIFEASMRDVLRSFAEAEAAPTPQERIEALIRSSFRTVRGNLPFWRLLSGSRMQSAVLAALGDRVPEWTNTIQQTLARYFRDAGAERPQMEATILFALIDGVTQHFVLKPERYPLDEVTEHIAMAYRQFPDRALFTRENTG